MAGGGFEEFYRDHRARHSTRGGQVTAALGDVLVALGGAVALGERRPFGRGFVLLALGFAVMVFGHVRYEHNAPAEFGSAARHPWWGVRADARMLRELVTGTGGARSAS